MSEKPELQQLHIEIPYSLYQDLKLILPERGMLTNLVRKFLHRYANGVKSYKELRQSPIEEAISSIIEEDIRRL